MILGSHVLPSVLNGEQVYLNTITRKYVNAGSDETTLRSFGMMENQRGASLEERLFSRPTECSLMLVTSWMCNLRCGHCSVLHQLKKSSLPLDPYRCRGFLDRYAEYYDVSKFNIHFLGGEALLSPEVVLQTISELSDLRPQVGLTTNLAMPLTVPIVRIIEKTNIVYVSLDGLEKGHNKQRKEVGGLVNDPFRTTCKNIQALVRLGMGDKVHVQAAVRDHFYKASYKNKFISLVKSLGIHEENISFGCVHTTHTNRHPENAYLKVLKSCEPITRPCCKYRFMSHFVVDGSNQLFSNYFSLDDSSLGSLDQPISEIESRYRRQIEETMACLQDPKCLTCPVIGMCWGKCVSGEPMFGRRPSDFCNQEALIQRASELCLSGKIWERYERTHCSAE